MAVVKTMAMTSISEKLSLPRKHLVKREDGCYRVVRVPIFTEHTRVFDNPKTGQQRRVTVDRKRLQKLARKLNGRKINDGYMASVHPEHHDRNGSDERLAYLDNLRVEDAVFEGRKRAVLFADYIVDDEKTLEEIDKYPYRSVEVNFNTDDISSLALMKSEAPFFKFPIYKREEALSYRANKDIDASFSEVASISCQSADEDCYTVLYRAAGESKGLDVPANPKKIEEAMAEDKKAEDAKKPMDVEPKAEKKAEEPKGDALEKKIEAYVSKCMKKYMEDMEPVKKFASQMSKYMEEEEEEEPKEEAKMRGRKGKKYEEDKKKEEEDSILPIAKARAGDNFIYSMDDVRDYIDGRLSYKDAEISEYRERIAELEARNEKSDILNWARSMTNNRVRPHDFEDIIETKYSERGAGGVKAFVEGFISGAPEVIEQDELFDGDENDPYRGENIPAEVAKYRGNDLTYRAACDLYEEFKTLPRAMKQGVSVADHIDNNIELAVKDLG